MDVREDELIDEWKMLQVDRETEAASKELLMCIGDSILIKTFEGTAEVS